MAEQILVALRGRDGLEQIIPYIEEIVQPGAQVVFLFRYPVDPWGWLRDHWIDTESPREATAAARKITEHYSWEKQRAQVNEKVLPALKALQEKGVAVSVKLYTGRLSEVVSRYALNGDAQLIMMQGISPLQNMRFLRAAMSLFGFLRQPSPSPVLLLHPNHGSLS